jgi:hypothetical protein
MKLLLASALLLASIRPVMAQVERVAIRTTGISCGVCALVSEIHFKRMAGVEKVTISRSEEAILLSYKPGAAFAPRRIREVLQPLEVGVVQFQITARGRVQEGGGKRLFIAGQDRFVLAPAGDAPAIPPGAPLRIEGIVNDRLDPMELKILDFKPLKQYRR